ncbi:hypothetical protein LY76DRAFT_7831 [Colletotrichum caudatum]|nr:hypothetical protein LY76DRAFT_7831 [Colletotrichum caudatum]
MWVDRRNKQNPCGNIRYGAHRRERPPCRSWFTDGAPCRSRTCSPLRLINQTKVHELQEYGVSVVKTILTILPLCAPLPILFLADGGLYAQTRRVQNLSNGSRCCLEVLSPPPVHVERNRSRARTKRAEHMPRRGAAGPGGHHVRESRSLLLSAKEKHTHHRVLQTNLRPPRPSATSWLRGSHLVIRASKPSRRRRSSRNTASAPAGPWHRRRQTKQNKTR